MLHIVNLVIRVKIDIGSKNNIYFKDKIICHNAEDPENIVYLGETNSGYEVELNLRVIESDLIIYVKIRCLRDLMAVGNQYVCAYQHGDQYLGIINDESYLKICNRIKNVIKSGGSGY